MQNQKSLYRLPLSGRETVQSIGDGLEHAVEGLTNKPSDLIATVYTTEQTPYIDAGILTEWIKKALVRQNKTFRTLSVGLNGKEGKNELELNEVIS